jgi:hypothetical protein
MEWPLHHHHLGDIGVAGEPGSIDAPCAWLQSSARDRRGGAEGGHSARRIQNQACPGSSFLAREELALVHELCDERH